jgi:hypothetical protein
VATAKLEAALPAGVNVMADYMAEPGNANYQAMHSASQNMAGLMGSQMGQVFSAGGPSGSVDVNRYRGMMGAIFSNMSSIRGSHPNSLAAMSELRDTMMSDLQGIAPGQPFRNMSTHFRGG